MEELEAIQSMVGPMMTSVFHKQEAWRLHQDVKHQSNHDQCVSDLSEFVYLGEIILASAYKIDFIGSGASLKADQEVRRFCIILTNNRCGQCEPEPIWVV